MEKPRKSFKTNISLIKSNKSSCADPKKSRGKFLFLRGTSFDPWRVLNFRNKSREERLKKNQSRVHVELNHESWVKNDDIESINPHVRIFSTNHHPADLLPPATKSRQDNALTPVCQSFCSQGVGLHPSGQYTSYWNAFLFPSVNTWAKLIPVLLKGNKRKGWLKKVDCRDSTFQHSYQWPWCKEIYSMWPFNRSNRTRCRR